MELSRRVSANLSAVPVAEFNPPDTNLDQVCSAQIGYERTQLDNVVSKQRFPKKKVNCQMAVADRIAGLAALTIIESLLLELSEGKILSEKEITGVLKDAAAAHESVPSHEQDETHAGVASLINKMVSRRDARRRR